MKIKESVLIIKKLLVPDELKFFNYSDDALSIFTVFVDWTMNRYHVNDEILNKSSMQLQIFDITLQYFIVTIL